MLQVEMSASIRKESGKGEMRRLRMNGQTPAIVYGTGVENVALKLETQPLFKQLLEIYRTNAVISLKLDDGSEKNVILKEVQTDPVSDTLIHADFLEIDLKKVRKFAVPVVFNGNAKGCDLGGVLNTIYDTVVLEGTPMDIPDNLEIDVSSLEIGESIAVGSLVIPKGLNLITDKDATCVIVSRPGGGAEEEEEEGLEEAAEETAEEPAAEAQE